MRKMSSVAPLHVHPKFFLWKTKASRKKNTSACAAAVAAPGGVFIFFVDLRLSKKDLDNLDFSWCRHFLFLA
jgi:hypothetical protein